MVNKVLLLSRVSSGPVGSQESLDCSTKEPANGKTPKRSRERCASCCTTYIIYNEGRSGPFFFWGQGCRVRASWDFKKHIPYKTKTNNKKNTAQGSQPTDFQEHQVRAGSAGGEEAGGIHPSTSHRPACAPSGYVMVSLSRVPAPIRVLQRCP